MRNKILSIIAVAMFPLVVISFVVKSRETNFILESDEWPGIASDRKAYSIRMVTDGGEVELDLEDYVVGVVAGEMPASFDEEALKAQAVASRTFALYKTKTSGGVIANDVSAQVYSDENAMKEKWGDNFQSYYDRIRKCVRDTEGKIITYDGEVIEAFYFAMSSGNTNDAATVFGTNRDYLTSVVSEYDTEELRGYKTETSMPAADFKSKLGLTCDTLDKIKIEREESHYVSKMTVCSKDFKGTVVRSTLGLRSADFDISLEGDTVKIEVLGYGHGVGMSQYGANGYAKAGYTYEDILKHYYKGIEIKSINDV